MKNKWLWFAAGLISLIGGMFALANPFSATITAELFAGWTLLFSGFVMLFSAFGKGMAGSRWAAVLVGIMVLLLGLFLINNPLHGVVSLTVAAAMMLIVAGIGRIVMAFAEQQGVRWALIFSGVISLLLAGMIFANFPASATVMLGIFLGVELISNGISLMVLALAAPKAAAA